MPHRAKIWGEVTLSLPLSLTAITLFPRSLHGERRYLRVTTRAMPAKCMFLGFLATRLGVANIMASRPGIVTERQCQRGPVCRSRNASHHDQSRTNE